MREMSLLFFRAGTWHAELSTAFQKRKEVEVTAARQDIHHQEPEFVTLDLRNPVEVFRQELTAQAEALAAIEAVRTLAPSLQTVGLRHLTIALSSSGGLCLTGLLPSVLEFEFEPTHAISVALRQAASQAGGWIETIEFQVTHGE